MQIHNIKRIHPNKESRRIGRGGVHGKTSGRGTKGQNARAGHKKRPEIRDIIKKIPKKRGYGKNRAQSVVHSDLRPVAINMTHLEKNLEAGVVTMALLVEKGIVDTQKGKIPHVKILANGEVTKKFTIKGLFISEGAKAKIVAAGGSVE